MFLQIFGRIARLLSQLASVFVVNVSIVFERMAEILWLGLRICPKLDALVSSFNALLLMLEHPSVSDKAVMKILDIYGKVKKVFGMFHFSFEKSGSACAICGFLVRMVNGCKR